MIKKPKPHDNKIGDGSEQWDNASDSHWAIPGMGPLGMPGTNNVSSFVLVLLDDDYCPYLSYPLEGGCWCF